MAPRLSKVLKSFVHNTRPLVSNHIKSASHQVRRLSTESTSDDFKNQNTEKLDEDHFYSCTTLRVFHNEKAQLQERYLKFNIPALRKAVVDAVDGATSIVNFTKYAEGGFNKMIHLSTDSGKEVIARLAYPKRVGCTEQAIESEVATMEFIRERMGVPVPRVLGWCSKPEDTEVNAAYILMERAKGQPASRMWDILSMTEKTKIVKEVVEIHRKMLRFKFPAYGSIYYRGAVKGDCIPIDDEYVIGPGVSLALTDEGRHSIDTFRGPWTSCDEYLQSLTDVEKQWIKKHADPGDFRGPKYLLPFLQNASAHLDLLDKIGKLIPLTTFREIPNLRRPVLWHPKFCAGDIIISDDTLEGKSTQQIVSLIDWQHSIVGPMYLQASPPHLFTNLKQWRPQLINESTMIKNFYYNRLDEYKDLFAFGVLWKREICKILKKVHNGCFKLWGNNFMEVWKALLELEMVWQECQGHGISPGLFPFPICEEDRKYYQKEYEQWRAALDSHLELCDQIGIDSNGWTREDDIIFTYYQYISKKADWIRSGKAESEWPFEGLSNLDKATAELEQEMMENARKEKNDII